MASGDRPGGGCACFVLIASGDRPGRWLRDSRCGPCPVIGRAVAARFSLWIVFGDRPGGGRRAVLVRTASGDRPGGGCACLVRTAPAGRDTAPVSELASGPMSTAVPARVAEERSGVFA